MIPHPFHAHIGRSLSARGMRLTHVWRRRVIREPCSVGQLSGHIHLCRWETPGTILDCHSGQHLGHSRTRLKPFVPMLWRCRQQQQQQQLYALQLLKSGILKRGIPANPAPQLKQIARWCEAAVALAALRARHAATASLPVVGNNPTCCRQAAALERPQNEWWQPQQCNSSSKVPDSTQ